ncbi:4Fe-4S binding protein [Deinococcus radiophilus]|uniref:4Fe-4S dicluster domain-containing protein n=1 Tax=Deinococcus radiophilus TaxID=32062 RepID=A0A3S0L379_9DEIO|nr:4Fe-4S binding protein [Deinococcus radiophilus]RTR25930.1 4Fe-4S dicluster domain-containing protein [Deinococcus radiophilus]UFA49722.1 4Fe-4S binding protein [Deinococcus radiophilus]
MWEQWLDRLADMGTPEPRYTAQRCLRERQAIGGCDLCAQACPHEAVILGPLGNAVTIDPDLCTGCGLCVQTCPSGALEYDLSGPLGSVREQRSGPEATTPNSEATLTCSQSGAGGPAVTCLGRVTPALLSAAGAWQVPLTLLHGDCAACPVGAASVPQRLHRVVQDAERLRAATGQPAQVTVRRAEAQDAERAQRVTRRGALGQLVSSGRRELVGLIPERPLPFVDWSEPEQRTPEEWRWRKASLQPTPPPGSAVYWPAPLVDDSCMDCPVCSNVCPTEAITRTHDAAGTLHLTLDLSACTGCMACVDSCPPRAMHRQNHWQASALEAPLILFEKMR